MRQVDGSIPVECLVTDNVNVQHDFNTFIGHITYVRRNLIVNVCRSRNYIVIKHIACFLAIVFDCTTHTAIEQLEVQTNVEHRC